MDKKTRAAVFAALPLLAAGLVMGSVPLADAANPRICGVQMCSEIPGGREAWEAQRSTGVPVATPQAGDRGEGEAMESKDAMEKEAESDHMQGEAMEGDAMEKNAMKDGAAGDAMSESMEKEAMTDHMAAHAHMELRLSAANVPAVIPLHLGYHDGGDVHFIITDSSDQAHAEVITAAQGWKVELAPLLAEAPDEALSRTYMFSNGIAGDGVHGFQGEVFTTVPGDEGYSALTSHVHVAWNDDAEPRLLTSEADIMAAEEAGDISLVDLPVVINMPHVMWPGGQLQVKADKELAHDTAYGGGQVLDIDTDAMTATFVAHRGWGPDGRTIYYIVTDATPSGPAEGMGVVHTPSSASLIANPAAVDLYQFSNGIAGPGPLGFQPGVAFAGPGDANYSPMWRISLATWEDPSSATLVETTRDINTLVADGSISVGLARPMDSDHIVNCPFIDPFQ
ncbi:MAG: hypothetical protein MPI95_00055 [Nitrosopumilus sp.]|nr:hypothetical protein [Nitrosopumilus sp.]MDA7943267.1 hypothetical protein [Nitrosopumilus sp.]MDA7952334.1 hypothetical protein [Nitrosopumilus sp.]MDA7957472.1 hypothetical protein [Nitrosopumilus sp.]MDA7998250.1 hypothetical protein [Nitrosopumilus sp.]